MGFDRHPLPGRRARRPVLHLTLAAAAAALAGVAAAPQAKAATPACNRACLEGFADAYMAALAKRDPRGAPLAKYVKFTENNVALEIGDGLWGTVTGVSGGESVLKVADPRTGMVGWWGAVTERDVTSPIAVRLKIEGGKITEVETMVARKSYIGANFPMDVTNLKHDPLWYQPLPANQRLSREKLISYADGYFSTLELNDGVLRTAFAPDCARLENGLWTAGNPDPKASANSRQDCGTQFKTGQFHIDDRVRDRRHFLVDEERGIVMSAGWIDHAASQTEITLTNGTKRPSGIKAPHNWSLIEMFKVHNGQLARIEANFIAVPYRMPSPWVLDGAPTNNRLTDYPLPRQRKGREMLPAAARK
jgi:hypothetical protein